MSHKRNMTPYFYYTSARSVFYNYLQLVQVVKNIVYSNQLILSRCTCSLNININKFGIQTKGACRVYYESFILGEFLDGILPEL